MRGERPRSTDAHSLRPRCEASKRGIRKATARAPQPSGAFAGCPRQRNGHSPDRDWPHGARLEGAEAHDHPAPCAGPGRAARGAARRPGLEVERWQGSIADAPGAEGSLALTTGPIPDPSRATGDRPLLRRAYRTLMMCSSGTTEPTDAIFIPDHPLPLVSARRVAGCGSNQTKEILSAKQLVSAHYVRELPFAISYSIRLEALIILREREPSPADIAKAIDEDVSAVTNHLRELYDAGCIEFVGPVGEGNLRKSVYRGISRRWQISLADLATIERAMGLTTGPIPDPLRATGDRPSYGA